MCPDAPSAPPAAARPVAIHDRLPALDVLRGVALLGIILVNAAFFAYPLGVVVLGVHGDEPLPDRFAWAFVRTFAEYKFISTFSLLFGAGVALHAARVAARGGDFLALHLRRMAGLAAIGAIHALLIWYGDILFVYAFAGLLLLALVRLRARTLATIAAVLLAVNVVLDTGFMALMSAMGTGGELPLAANGSIVPMPGVGEAPNPTASALLSAPFDAERMRYETAVMSGGTFLQATAVRAFSWFSSLLSAFAGYGWRVLGMFVLGAALAKAQFFAAPGAALRRRLLPLLPVGVVLECVSTALAWPAPGELARHGVPSTVLHEIGGIATCLGLAAAVAALAIRRGPGGVLAPFAAAGRCALSVYIGESLVMTGLMNGAGWGLGWFGTVGRAELLGLVVACYAVLAVLAMLWLGRFRTGPLEAAWRSVTYLGLRRAIAER